MRISFSDVGFSYDTQPILRDFYLDIPSAQKVAIVGVSGIGKSTILSLASGLSRPSHGHITVSEQAPEIVLQEGRIGFLFQTPALFPWLTCRENVSLPSKIAGVQIKTVEQSSQLSTEQAMTMAGIEHAADKYPHELSGGMRARAALAVQYYHQPELMLLDEPFANVDDIMKQALLRKLAISPLYAVQTIVMVTHNIMDAVKFGDRVVVLNRTGGDLVHVCLDIETGFGLDALTENLIEVETEIREALQ